MTENENTHDEAGRSPAEWDADDFTISAAMHRVSVPPQAIARVRAQLRAAAREPATAVAMTSSADVNTDSTVTSDVRTNVQGQRVRRQVLRRVVIATTALAASVVFLLLYVQSRPLTANQLASVCVEQLELVVEQMPQWQAATEDAATKLEPLMRNLNQRLTLVGSKQHPPGSLAKSCTLWKFDTGKGKYLYVFDLQDARTIRDIPSRFRVIKQSSSSWSLAALQQGGRVFVVAVEGDVTEFIKSLEYA